MTRNRVAFVSFWFALNVDQAAAAAAAAVVASSLHSESKTETTQRHTKQK